MISIWEKQSFLEADFIIIGAGITGLSAAASIKEKDPQCNVIVLERGVLPSGASTKNAGFACFGSASELLSDISKLGEDGMVNLVEKRWKGLQKTIKRLGENKIDLQTKSGYELTLEDDNFHERLEEINELLFPLFRSTVFRLADEKLPSFGFGCAHHLIENQLEGQLDTGKLISSLWQYCSQLDVAIHTGCKVMDLEEDGKKVHVKTNQLTFSTKKVGICTNAFTKKLLPEVTDLHPGRGAVLLVSPEEPLKFEGTFHYDEGFYYFRDYYGQVIFGGGRNLDIQEEETTTFGVRKEIKEKLIKDLNEIILPHQPFEIEMEWSGIMAFGETKEPIVKKVSDRMTIGVRLGGMGVAIGSLVGEEVANLLLN